MSAISNAFNYAQVDKKALSSRGYRATIRPKSAQSYAPTSTLTLELPTLPRTYAMLASSYISAKVAMNVAQDTNNALLRLDSNVYSLISRITISSGGQVISDLNDVAKIYHYLLQSQTSPQFARNYAATCLGAEGGGDLYFVGKQINKTGINVQFPLLHSIFTANRAITLDSSSPITIQITFNSTAGALVQATSVAQDGDFVVSDVEWHCPFVELSQEADLLVNQSLAQSGMSIDFQDIASSSDSISATESNLNFNMGFRFSSIQNIAVLQFKQQADAITKFNQSSRAYGAVSEVYWTIGATRYPSQPLKCSPNNFGEIMSELLISNNTLSDPQVHSYFNMQSAPVVADPSSVYVQAEANAIRNATLEVRRENCKNFEALDGDLTSSTMGAYTKADLSKFGTFATSYSFEAFKSNQPSGAGLIEGLSSLGSQTYYNAKYDTTSKNFALDIHAYCFFNAVLTMDMVTRQWYCSN